MKKICFIITLLVSSVVQAQTLRMAVYQYSDNPRIKNLQPLADHLQQQLGIPTAVKSYPTVHALIKGMQAEEVDIAFISTFGYLLLKAASQQHPMIPVVALTAPNAKDNYKTAVVAIKKSTIATMNDLKQQGKKVRMAFVATGSTSGNLVPRLLLNRVGITDADIHFANVKYAGTHAKAIEWLLSDSADVAAMGSTEWDKLDSTTRSRLRLLQLSSEIPLGPVLLNRALDKSVAAKITGALVKLHLSNSVALEAIKAAWSEAKQATHFIRIDENHYTPYLKQFGNPQEVEKITRKFIQ